MSLPMLGILGIVILLAVMFLMRMPVGFAMAVVGFCGLVYVLSWKAALGLIGNQLWSTFSSYGLTVIPLFILMGEICFYSNINTALYDTAYKWLGQVKGGLAMTTILACAGFAAICGSNTATAATMSAVALPEMKKYGYHPALSTGSIACGSTLGVVIPPSVVLVVYGIYTGNSIARLFFGSFVPGLVLTALLIFTVYLICIKHPDWGPTGPKFSWIEKLKALPESMDMVIIFILVMVGLYVGYYTPSEAGAAGAFAALIISLIRKRLTWRRLLSALIDTLVISCFIIMIVAGAVIFGKFLAVTRLPYVASEWASHLNAPPVLILSIIIFIYLVGGCVMDALGLLLITIPIFYPVVIHLGYDPIWFGVLITVVTTMGAVTPPVGVSAYVVSGMAKDIPLATVFRGVIYFLPAYIVGIALLIVFPQMATYVASLVRL